MNKSSALFWISAMLMVACSPEIQSLRQTPVTSQLASIELREPTVSYESYRLQMMDADGGVVIDRSGATQDTINETVKPGVYRFVIDYLLEDKIFLSTAHCHDEEALASQTHDLKAGLNSVVVSVCYEDHEEESTFNEPPPGENTDPSADVEVVPDVVSDDSEADSADSQSGEDMLLVSDITQVQPFTGLVLWDTSSYRDSDAIQLEYAYVGYDEVAKAEGVYDWSSLDAKLDAMASRGHQGIIRFYYTYPGHETRVPQFIKNSVGYAETNAFSEGLATSFPDWRSQKLMDFTKRFMEAFAERYDTDRRLAYLQVGFGLWGEYHIYDGPFEVGVTFPSEQFQAEFLKQMHKSLERLRWSVSVDIADHALMRNTPDLVDLNFGTFDDSLLHQSHQSVNGPDHQFLGRERSKVSPVGGELSYYSTHDQMNALSPEGPHGVPFKDMALQYGVSYVIGNDQPDYHSGNMEVLKKHGMMLGYSFELIDYDVTADGTKLVVKNTGVAPLYYDAYFKVGRTTSSQSLAGLAPGETLQVAVPDQGTPTIVSPWLLDGQTIQYKARIKN